MTTANRRSRLRPIEVGHVISGTAEKTAGFAANTDCVEVCGTSQKMKPADDRVWFWVKQRTYRVQVGLWILCRPVGFYVRKAERVRYCTLWVWSGRGVENQTRAGIHFKLNVCSNKRMHSYFLCRHGLHML